MHALFSVTTEDSILGLTPALWRLVADFAVPDKEAPSLPVTRGTPPLPRALSRLLAHC